MRERDRAAGLALTIQIVAKRKRGSRRRRSIRDRSIHANAR